MRAIELVGGVAAATVMTLAGSARAEEAPRPAAEARGHASGFMVQARLQTPGGLPYVSTAPSFLLGYQGRGFALGLGLGLARLGVSGSNDASGSGTLFHVMPTALIDVWQSKDGRARANVLAGIGYGRGSLEVTNTGQSCTALPAGGESCTTTRDQNKASLGFLPVMLGFGGDYFLSRNFALGTEVGLQGAFATSIDTTSDSVTRDVDGSANLQLAYAALRATLVLGD